MKADGRKFTIRHALALAIAMALAMAFPVIANAAQVEKHFSVADERAQEEGEPWLDIYQDAAQSFSQGDDVANAIAELNYLAYQGSAAAAIRLCAIYAYGVKNPVNPMSGLFWCGKALQAGYVPANQVRRELYIKHWREYEEEEE